MLMFVYCRNLGGNTFILPEDLFDDFAGQTLNAL